MKPEEKKFAGFPVWQWAVKMFRRALPLCSITECETCREIHAWNEVSMRTEPIDEYYIKALKLLQNRREKAEIADVIAKILRNNAN